MSTTTPSEVLQSIADVFNEVAENEKKKKQKLKVILEKEWKKPGVSTKYTNQGDFIRQTFEDYMGDALDKDDKIKKECNITGSLADLSKKIKIVNNLWVNEGDTELPEHVLKIKEIFNDVYEELNK